MNCENTHQMSLYLHQQHSLQTICFNLNVTSWSHGIKKYTWYIQIFSILDFLQKFLPGEHASLDVIPHFHRLNQSHQNLATDDFNVNYIMFHVHQWSNHNHSLIQVKIGSSWQLDESGRETWEEAWRIKLTNQTVSRATALTCCWFSLNLVYNVTFYVSISEVIQGINSSSTPARQWLIKMPLLWGGYRQGQ